MRPLRTVWIGGMCALVACASQTQAEQTDATPDVVPWLDSDGDRIADVHEGDDDADGDGKDNALDLDSDDDGLSDRVEAGDERLETLPLDRDLDGVPDFLDLDSDGNCLSDNEDGDSDQDGDGIIDAYDLDDDGDGLSDIEELYGCSKIDRDGDGQPDYHDEDSDNDGVLDLFEGAGDTDGDGLPDRWDLDSDGDGYTDAEEAGGSPPMDVDGDGVPDFQDVDSDGDGLLDIDEIDTDPYVADSDGDGQTDGIERAAGSDPLDDESVVDGVVVTLLERTTQEVVVEHELRLKRTDLALLLDMTTSMGSWIGPSIADLVLVAKDLKTHAIDPRIGVARYQEYAAAPMSSGRDVPYRLEQQMTGDFDAALSGLTSLAIDYSAGNRDWPETGMEALYQAMSGDGYDLLCDGTFDPVTDVQPFIASGSDPFGGAGGDTYDASDTTTGTVGGMGFRAHATPVFLVLTDADMRDPDRGDPVPGGCPGEAGHSDVIRLANDLDAKIIGLATAPVADPQLIDLSTESGAVADLGSGPQPLTFRYVPSDPSFRKTLSSAIQAVAPEIELDVVELAVDSDPDGLVADLGEAVTGVTEAYVDGDKLAFTVLLRASIPAAQDDTIRHVVLRALEDGQPGEAVHLWIRIPPR